MTKRSKESRHLTGKSKLRLHAASSHSEISKKKTKRETKNSTSEEKNDWEDAVCPVCIERPHEAVLLLCSSHKKGCRPYICATSHEFSNCLDRYTKACPKTEELSCPLCRGNVSSWTVVKPAREFLNAKKRSCSQDNCSFRGKFEDLREHMKLVHPLAKPKEVDPKLEEDWKTMEEETARNDVISTIGATTPGALVIGDYVIENSGRPIPGASRGLAESITSLMNFLLTMPELTNSASASLSSRLRRHEMRRTLQQAGTGNLDVVAEPGASEGSGDSGSRARLLARLANRAAVSRPARRQRRRRQEGRQQ